MTPDKHTSAIGDPAREGDGQTEASASAPSSSSPGDPARAGDPGDAREGETPPLRRSPPRRARAYDVPNRSRARAIAAGALCAALIVLFLFLGNLIDVADLTFAALSTLLIWFLTLEFGRRTALGAYLAATILSFLLLPNKAAPLLFTGFFGWYPLAKPTFDCLPRLPRAVLKLLTVNAACVGLSLLFSSLMGLSSYSLPFLLLLLLLYNLAFLLFDVAMTRFVPFYHRRLRPVLVRAGLCK